jgi:hypothetical protein
MKLLKVRNRVAEAERSLTTTGLQAGKGDVMRYILPLYEEAMKKRRAGTEDLQIKLEC